MGLSDPYFSVEAFKARVGTRTNDDDAQIEAALLAASRVIDGFAGQSFYVGEAGEVRYFTVIPASYGRSPWGYRNRSVVDVDPFIAVTEVAIDNGQRLWETVLEEDEDFVVGPTGADLKALPYTTLEAIGTRAFPYGRDQVRVTGTFGWPEVPSSIAEACFILANRNKSSWTAPFGVAGSGDLGQLQASMDLTPSIKQYIAPYRAFAL